jgi:hypothetical protein
LDPITMGCFWEQPEMRAIARKTPARQCMLRLYTDVYVLPYGKQRSIVYLALIRR